jgi:thiamine-monophosphate kinase
MKRLNEKEIVDLFILNFKKLKSYSTNECNYTQDYTATRIGSDDVSIISPSKRLNRGFRVIFKCDMLVESTDVPLAMRPWQIARKSIVSCVSDFSAKGIKPLYFSLISIGIPTRYSKDDILELVRGFKISSREYGVNFVGGDTNESNELIIDCSMLGFSDFGNIPSRNGSSPGDFIVVSGEFGYSAAGLKILNEGAKAAKSFKQRAVSSVVNPKPQQKFGISLAKYFTSAIDSSDGLAISLYELASQSRVNFVINKIPSAKGIERFAKDNSFLDSNELIFHGGEEYHIVATVSPQNMKRLQPVAEKLNLKMLVIGRVAKGDGKVFVPRSENTKEGFALLDNRGYIHFISKHRK